MKKFIAGTRATLIVIVSYMAAFLIYRIFMIDGMLVDILKVFITIIVGCAAVGTVFLGTYYLWLWIYHSNVKSKP